MNRRKKKTRAVLAALLAALTVLLYIHRFKEVNAGINYSVENAQVGEPVQANLSSASTGSLSTITVVSARDRAGETKYARVMAAPSDSIVDSGSSASSMPIIGSHCQEVPPDWR